MYPPDVRLWDALSNITARIYSNAICFTDTARTYDDYITARCYEHSVGEVAQWLDRRYLTAVKKHNSKFNKPSNTNQ